MSQRSKVLFVDEPRMIRTAFVHFASEEDMEQARAAFRNTQVLGSVVDVVPVRLPAFYRSQSAFHMFSPQTQHTCMHVPVILFRSCTCTREMLLIECCRSV